MHLNFQKLVHFYLVVSIFCLFLDSIVRVSKFYFLKVRLWTRIGVYSVRCFVIMAKEWHKGWPTMFVQIQTRKEMGFKTYTYFFEKQPLYMLIISIKANANLVDNSLWVNKWVVKPGVSYIFRKVFFFVINNNIKLKLLDIVLSCSQVRRIYRVISQTRVFIRISQGFILKLETRVDVIIESLFCFAVVFYLCFCLSGIW